MKKIVIIVLILLIISIGGVGVYVSHFFEKVNIIEIAKKDEDLGIKEEILEKENREIINIALFGTDNPNQNGRSDTIIIASLDTKRKKIKLTSIMRDTYVDIPGRGMDKINHAYAFGGPELSLKTINQNFDMSIRDFVTVDFEGLENIINALGGIEVTIKNNEAKYVPVSSAGPQILDGKQALAYSRIRKTGNGDFERTERQRSVLEKIMNKGINAGIMNYPKLLNTILPYVETSLSKSEILKLGTSTFTSDVKNIEQFRIPTDEHGKGEIINKIYYLVPKTLKDNVLLLHEFIYED